MYVFTRWGIHAMNFTGGSEFLVLSHMHDNAPNRSVLAHQSTFPLKVSGLNPVDCTFVIMTYRARRRQTARDGLSGHHDDSAV